MSGLLTPFGLPRASPPLQGPILRYFSILLDFLVPPLCLKVQSSAISRSFWTFSCLSSASKSNPPLLLAPFGLSPASPLLQSPILRSFSLLLDFLVPPLHFKVQSSDLLLTPFGLPPASPPLQSPILLSFSLLLDFLLPPLRFKVQSTTLPLPSTQKRRIAKQSASPIPLFPCQSSANSTK